MIWPAYVFRKHNTPENFDPATCLVYGGVYCYSRNPMYLGGVICLAGLALCSGNLLSFISPLVFFVFMQWMFIPHEEVRLTEIFEKEYQEYKTRVRCWL